MSIDSYGLIEHFNYMTNYIPQPFSIKSEDVVSIYGSDSVYTIKTKDKEYSLSLASMKKLVSALGVKFKLLSSASNEDDVFDLAMPAINKLFKCFADCFVFYSHADDRLNIIDLNVNSVKGEEGTKYENGPSLWPVSVEDHPMAFTCFANFKKSFDITNKDTDILVKAEDLTDNVKLKLFKDIHNECLQPMLVFSTKFSNMNGFSEIHLMLYDIANDIEIVFPMNYANKEGQPTFDSLWNKVLHLYETTDFNDYIFREMNELSVLNETPAYIKKFISNIALGEVSLNMNQPINMIISEAMTLGNSMKPKKFARLKKDLGMLIGFCIASKHFGCNSCGHILV